MKQRVVIIGAGITGMITAYLLHLLDESIEITVIDAGPQPSFSGGSGKIGEHFGATLGQGRDARHFTGTEGLSFQNPVHAELVHLDASEDSPGWQTIPEGDLTPREKSWREECIDRFKRHVKPEFNPYDQMYVALNYGGMAAWNWLTQVQPEINKFRISNDNVYVIFKDNKELQADFDSETKFNFLQARSPIELKPLSRLYDEPKKVFSVDKIASQVLELPGASWRIQSLWEHLYKALSSRQNAEFVWNSPVRRVDSLPNADAYIWAAGSAYDVPDIYSDHGRVQGIGGWWLTIPNPGFKAQFKFSAPQPSGYINFTPDGSVVYISGGFGWVGERGYKDAERLLQPAKKHLLNSVSGLLNLRPDQVNGLEAGCCIRPTTPTGLPDIKTKVMAGKKHIMISGAGKAGSTQAPLLAMHVAQEIGLGSQLDTKLAHFHDSTELKIIRDGLDLMHSGLEP